MRDFQLLFLIAFYFKTTNKTPLHGSGDEVTKGPQSAQTGKRSEGYLAEDLWNSRKIHTWKKQLFDWWLRGTILALFIKQLN